MNAFRTINNYVPGSFILPILSFKQVLMDTASQLWMRKETTLVHFKVPHGNTEEYRETRKTRITSQNWGSSVTNSNSNTVLPECTVLRTPPPYEYTSTHGTQYVHNTGNDVLSSGVHTPYPGVLYFQNVIRLKSFMKIGRFSRYSSMLNIIMCRFLIQNVTQTWKERI